MNTALTYLSELSKLYPTVEAAIGRIALLSSYLDLPKRTTHVVSDVHGEYKKLRHVLNNGSGAVRTLVDRVFGSRLPEAEKLVLLSFIYYPRESYAHHGTASQRPDRSLLSRVLCQELELIREIAKNYPLEEVAHVLPKEYLQLFRELLLGPFFGRDERSIEDLVARFSEYGQDLPLLRSTAHVVRNLVTPELIVAGDLGDRGPRIDKVIDLLRVQPNVSIIWGNHDTVWLAACLGHEASIASVLRLSLRYGNTAQLEEGYGIPLDPLEDLVEAHYRDDPAPRFTAKATKARDPLLLARMQKAAALLQFKLERAVSERNPHFEMSGRNLLHRIDSQTQTVTIGVTSYPLADTLLPTVDPADPYRLSEAERVCINRFRDLFTSSPRLWEQMKFVTRRTRMYTTRDDVLIFHGCVPVDSEGKFVAFEVDGKAVKGRALFDALDESIQKTLYHPNLPGLDLLWYLWCGAKSPLFGKDKIATFESYFIEDKEAAHETKNPYFALLHEKAFCQQVLQEFGIHGEQGLIVNGHLPVKVDKGEEPVKRSGMAVTIDGAFSEAYGDRGYTLILSAERISLANHHHFESVDDSIRNGSDMLPETQDIRTYASPRLIADSDRGAAIVEELRLLDDLISAYRTNKIAESRES